jgi:hypothetical protein
VTKTVSKVKSDVTAEAFNKQGTAVSKAALTNAKAGDIYSFVVVKANGDDVEIAYTSSVDIQPK